jgi:hypothetical protein
LRPKICWSALLCCAAATAQAQAQAFPDRPLRIIVAFTTGTAADIVARQMALMAIFPMVLVVGGDIVAGGPAELDKAMRGGTAKWGSLVKEIEAQGR